MLPNNFDEFCESLLVSGFSMGGGSSKGIYAIVPFGWEEQENMNTPIKWHTGIAQTDPWEWRMRVLEERTDIAYGKLFFKASGYIAKKWYSAFYSVRRCGRDFAEIYADGKLSRIAKTIYEILDQNNQTPLHEIKRLGGFTKDDNSAFERALTDLQMQMLVTMCGRAQRLNKYGEGYSWNSTVLCTVEQFWEERGYEINVINPQEAYNLITAQIYKLNPDAEEKTIKKFIYGK